MVAGREREGWIDSKGSSRDSQSFMNSPTSKCVLSTYVPGTALTTQDTALRKVNPRGGVYNTHANKLVVRDVKRQ